MLSVNPEVVKGEAPFRRVVHSPHHDPRPVFPHDRERHAGVSPVTGSHRTGVLGPVDDMDAAVPNGLRGPGGCMPRTLQGGLALILFTIIQEFQKLDH